MSDLEATGDSSRGGDEPNIAPGEEPRHVFFYKTSSPFSNFHPAKFKMIVRQPGLSVARELPGDTQPAGRVFSYFCSEQAMMHAKALLFGDYSCAARVMDATKPQHCKKLGRDVGSFRPQLWDQYKVAIVKAAVSCKFGQNRELRKALLETSGSLLVEAAPKDKVWGIGMSASEAQAVGPEQWRGLNLLGQILVEVREGLQSGEIPSSGLELELPRAALVEAMPEATGENRPRYDDEEDEVDEAPAAAPRAAPHQAAAAAATARGRAAAGSGSKAAMDVRSRILKRLGKKR